MFLFGRSRWVMSFQVIWMVSWKIIQPEPMPSSFLIRRLMKRLWPLRQRINIIKSCHLAMPMTSRKIMANLVMPLSQPIQTKSSVWKPWLSHSLMWPSRLQQSLRCHQDCFQWCVIQTLCSIQTLVTSSWTSSIKSLTSTWTLTIIMNCIRRHELHLNTNCWFWPFQKQLMDLSIQRQSISMSVRTIQLWLPRLSRS